MNLCPPSPASSSKRLDFSLFLARKARAPRCRRSELDGAAPGLSHWFLCPGAGAGSGPPLGLGPGQSKGKRRLGKARGGAWQGPAPFHLVPPILGNSSSETNLALLFTESKEKEIRTEPLQGKGEFPPSWRSTQLRFAWHGGGGHPKARACMGWRFRYFFFQLAGSGEAAGRQRC